MHSYVCTCIGAFRCIPMYMNSYICTCINYLNVLLVNVNYELLSTYMRSFRSTPITCNYEVLHMRVY